MAPGCFRQHRALIGQLNNRQSSMQHMKSIAVETHPLATARSPSLPWHAEHLKVQCVHPSQAETLSTLHSALHCIKTPRHRKSFISMGCCKWQMSMQAGHTCEGVPMVCLPIWHWYMLRGDWLKSLKGVRLATTLSMALQLISLVAVHALIPRLLCSIWAPAAEEAAAWSVEHTHETQYMANLLPLSRSLW